MGFKGLAGLLGLLLIHHFSFGLSVGEVKEYRGRVDLLKKGSLKGLPLERTGKDLEVGDILRTKSDGFAKVVFIDNNRVSVFPNSRLRIIDYKEVREVNITRGIVKFEISKGGRGLRIKTPTALIGVKGTVFYVFVTPAFTRVMVISGNVMFREVKTRKERIISPRQPQARNVMDTVSRTTFSFSNTPPPDFSPSITVPITFP